MNLYKNPMGKELMKDNSKQTLSPKKSLFCSRVITVFLKPCYHKPHVRSIVSE